MSESDQTGASKGHEEVMEIDPDIQGVYDQIMSEELQQNQQKQQEQHQDPIETGYYKISDENQPIADSEGQPQVKAQAQPFEMGGFGHTDAYTNTNANANTEDVPMGGIEEYAPEIINIPENDQDGNLVDIQEDVPADVGYVPEGVSEDVPQHAPAPAVTVTEVPEVVLDAEPETSASESNPVPTDEPAGATQPTTLAPENDESGPNTQTTRRTSESIPLQFALTTPLKALPALKDIEKITTPKPFVVARDSDAAGPDDSVILESSPMVQKRLSNESGDFLKPIQMQPISSETSTTSATSEVPHELASFLDISKSEINSIPQQVISKLSSKITSLLNSTSEFQLFKINQEQILQINEKKFRNFQSKIQELNEKSTEFERLNKELLNEKSKLTEEFDKKSKENNKLISEIEKIEKSKSTSSREIELRDIEISKLYDQISSLTSENIELNKNSNEHSKKLNDEKNLKFSTQLELNKSLNELSYTKTQKNWFEKELKSVQSRYTELIKKHETEYIITENKLTKVVAQKDALESTSKLQQEQLASLNKDLEAKSLSCIKLDGELNTLKQKCQIDMKSKQDLLELVQVQSSERQSRIDQLEKYIEEIKTKFGSIIEDLESNNKSQHQKIAVLSEKLKRTEDILDEELRKETELPKLNSAGEKLASLLAGGMSLSTLYTEFSHLKKQLLMERSQKEKLAYQLETFINELEAKKPAISNYKQQIRFYEDSLKDSFNKIENIRLEKLDNEKFTKTLNSRVNGLENELVSMKVLCKDLGRQLCFYLIHSKIRDSQDDPLTVVERKAIENILDKSGNNNNQNEIESDTDKLISERLVGFSSIIDLQQKNQELLTVVRQLGKQLENKDAEFSRDIESVAIDEAKEAILTLQSELETVSIKLNSVEKERDVFKNMLEDRNSGKISNGGSSDVSTLSFLQESNKDLKKQLKSSEDALISVREQSNNQLKELNAKLRASEEERSSLSLKVNNLQHSVQLTETRFKNSEITLNSIQLELNRVKTDSEFWKQQTTKQESSFINATNKLRNSENELSNAQIENKKLIGERDMWKSLEQSLYKDIEQLKTDKAQLSQFVTNLQLLLKDREVSSKQLSDRFSQSIENYQKLQEKLNEKEEKIMILNNQTELSMKAQNTKLEQLHELSQLLVDTRLRLGEKTAEVEKLESKIEKLELRQSIVGVSSEGSISVSAGSGGSVGDDKSLLEIDSLRKELRISEKQVEEFASIAKSAEEALINSTSAFDKFKTESDAQRKALEDAKLVVDQEVKELRDSLQNTKNEFDHKRQLQIKEIESIKVEAQQYKLKADAYDNLQKDYEVKLQSISSDLQAQIQLAGDFQSKFQNELAKNDTISSSIAALKQESSKYDEEINRLNKELASAKNELIEKLGSAEEVRQSTLEDLAKSLVKIQDLTNQNQILLNQLELKKPSDESDVSEGGESLLREVVNYLRHEKESAEAKLNLQLQEQQRLELKLQQINIELDTTKSDLRKAESTTIKVQDFNKDHDHLLEQIQQLNILRESNTTLRNENKLNIGTIQKINVEMNILRNQIQPLQKQVLDLTSDNAVKDQSVKLVKEELERYKQKLIAAQTSTTGNAALTSEELDALKSENEAAKKQNTELVESTNQLQAKITSTEGDLKLMTERFNNLKLEAQEKLKRRSTEVKELRDVIEGLKKDLDSVTQELNTLKNSTSASNDEVAKGLQAKIDQVINENASLTKKLSNLESKLLKSETNANAELTKLKEEYEAKLKTTSNSINEEDIKKKLDQEYETKIKEHIAKIDGADAVRSEMKKQFEEDQAKIKSEHEIEIQKVREDTRKISEKSAELKMRMLNKKISKLSEQLASSKKNAPASLPSIPQALVPLNPALTQDVNNGANNSANNSANNNNIRPAINRAGTVATDNSSTGQKRPFGESNGETPNKKAKE